MKGCILLGTYIEAECFKRSAGDSRDALTMDGISGIES